MEYLYEYLIFLAEVATVVIALLIILSAFAGMSTKPADGDDAGSLRVTKLNDQLRDLRHTMESHVFPPGLAKKQHKAEAKKVSKARKKQAREEKNQAQSKVVDDDADAPHSDKRVFYLQFEGDLKASAVDRLRREISAVITMALSNDEVVVAIESPGGMVNNYGLAASQLQRIRDKEIDLTVVVDKVAASGGYLMAVVADKIVAAPFALLGSIGVVAQIPNVHRLLKKKDVDVEVLTAGKFKRTLTVLGENTDEGRQKFVEELEDVHALFQEFVADYRPDIDLEVVATGEAWLGKRAIELHLVDELATSDEYLMQACTQHDVYAVAWQEHKKPIDRLLGRVNGLLGSAEDVLTKFSGRQ